MPEVTTYSFFVFGSPAGFMAHRAQVELSGPEGRLAIMTFSDPGAPVEADYETGDIIRMHLPAIMFGPVIDVLRNEGPIFVSFNNGVGILGSGAEPVGEGET
jgi:hypothetical protein